MLQYLRLLINYKEVMSNQSTDVYKFKKIKKVKINGRVNKVFRR